MFFRAVAILASGVSKLGYCFPVIQGYRNSKNKSISQFQEYRLRYHASVEDDTKLVQSAQCTRMRIVFSLIRLGPKTSVCEEKYVTKVQQHYKSSTSQRHVKNMNPFTRERGDPL